MKTRILASATHLFASAAVIAAFLMVVYFIWYPGPLFALHGTIDVVKLLIGVDLVLGPLMTMIIFDIRKPRKELVRDISIIVLVQVMALAWGAYATFKVRPEFVVFYQDKMYSVTRSDLEGKEAVEGLSIPALWQKPEYVYVPLLDPQEAIQLVMDMVSKGRPDIQYEIDRYRPLEQNKEELLKNAMDTTVYLDTEENRSHMDAFLKCNGGVQDDYAFFPLRYGIYRGIVGIERDSLKPMGLLGPVISD